MSKDLCFVIRGRETRIPFEDLRYATVVGGLNMSLHPAGPMLTAECGECGYGRKARFHDSIANYRGRPLFLCQACGKYNLIDLVMS